MNENFELDRVKLKDYSDYLALLSLFTNHDPNYNLLFLAIKSNSLQEVKRLVEKCNVDPNGNDRSPLYSAVSNNHFSIINYLLENGAHVNVVCDNYSPLFKASSIGCPKVVELLLKYGADIEFTDVLNHTSLMIACKNKHYEVVEVLLKNSAEMNKQTNNGNTALHLCVDKGDLKLINLLLTNGAKLNIPNEKKLTPLMVASLNFNIDIVEYVTSLPTCDKMERVKAYELLGVEHVIRNDNLTQARVLWKFVDGHKKIVSNYQNLQRFQSLETLTNDELYIRAMIIREWLLGNEDNTTLNFLVKVGNMFARHKKFSLCLDVFNYAFHFNGNVVCLVLSFFNACLYSMVGDPILVHRLDELLKGLNIVIEEIKSITIYNRHKFFNFVPTILSFVYILTLITKNNIKLNNLIRRLLLLPTPFIHETSWLHYVCQYEIKIYPLDSNRYEKVDTISLISLLMNLGADVNALDHINDTPLHVARNLSIMEKLLEYGAHFDAKNCKGRVFSFYSKKQSLKFCSLKCLAARVIKEHSICYEGHIPTCLHDFIEIH